MIVAYFDGACEPVNPRGIATYGVVVYKDDKKVYADYGLAVEPPLTEDSTNNVAEYTALIKVLEYLVTNNFLEDKIIVRGDSQLVIRQLLGIYAVRSDRIRALYNRAIQLVVKFKNIKFEWIPREYNTEADELSHKAYEEYLDNHPEVLEKVKRYLATEKQKKLLEKLGIKYCKYISKFEASRLISRRLKKRGRW